MQPTPIKINKSSANGQEPTKLTKNILNLNSSPAKPQKNNPLKKYLWLLLALILIASAAIVWLSLAKPISPYFKIIPREAIISSYFSQSSLLELLKSAKNNQAIWPPDNWKNNALQKIINKTRIEQPEQLLSLFEDQMALAVLPQKTGADPTWLMLASAKAPPDTFAQARDKTEQSLKQNYNLISESYRQIKISQVKPLEQDKNSLFYAQANNFFILTNDETLIKETIDRIIK